jgi:hypothetical protein
METVDAEQADAAAGPSDQEHANEQLSYAQGTIESVQSMRPDRTSESLPNSSTGYSKYTHPRPCYEESDHYQELNEQFQSYMEDPFYFKGADPFAQLQPGGGFPKPQEYYIQDVDWRAQQPSTDCEGEFPNSQDGNLQRSGPSEAEFSDLDSLINYSPQITPSSASTTYSILATQPDIKSPALVDTWQNEGMTNCMMAWTAHDQGARTVSPKDLFRASV